MTIRNMFTKAVGRQSLRLKKNSPHILFVGGVAGIVTSTVLACRATLKLEKALEGIEYDLNGLKSLPKNGEHKKDLAWVYAKSGFEITKLYAPAIAVGSLSIVALTGSHVQLSRRNAALTAAYTGLHQAYNEYRARVRDAIGTEKELDFYHGATKQQVEDSKGKMKDVKSIDPNKLSPYARFFDESSPNWTKDPEINFLFVKCQQNYANDLLRARGHVFLNEVYDMLGIDRSSAGQVVGWVINDEGDNFVDFGLYECESSRFVNGSERSILLDFNVDGVVYDKI